MSVFANKEMGIVRFIGEAEFAPGIWLGVELRKPSKYMAELHMIHLEWQAGIHIFYDIVRMPQSINSR